MDHPRAETLAKLLLIQSVVGQFSSEQDMVSFACRGLVELPGVSNVRFEASGESGNDGAFRFPITMEGHGYGKLVVDVSDAAVFEFYAAYVTNVCFMMALVLEERRLRRRDEKHSRLLEERVEERTRRLSEEVRDRLAAECEARAQQRRAERYLEVSGTILLELDCDGVVEVINDRGCAALGFDAHELIGASWFDLVVPRDKREEQLSLFRRVVAGDLELPGRFEYEVATRSGEKRLIEWRNQLRRGEDGRIEGTISAGTDVTESRRLIENTQRADRMASLAVLAGGIAHDFNNMLGGFFGFVELARAACAPDSQAVVYLDETLAVLERARGLTQQLLTFSKGGKPIQRSGPIHQLIRESIDFALSGSRILCHYDLPDDLWHCDFDESQVVRVFDNLALNAMQAMADGGRIRVSATNVDLPPDTSLPLSAGRFVRISVRDYGRGIAPDHLPRIFDPFFTTKKTGSGLGLATCYSIVQRHGGTIAVDVLPEGTAFHVWLPASRRQARELGAAVDMGLRRGTGTILVMDDERYLRAMLRKMLSTLGYHALEACNGEEAITLCRSRRESGVMLDGAILDLTVRGGMGGAEAVRHVRRIYPDIPVIASSGYAENVELSEPSAHGFTASLPKPYTLNELATLLEQHVAQRRRRPLQASGDNDDITRRAIP